MGSVSFLLLFLLSVLSFPEKGAGHPPSPEDGKPGGQSFVPHNGTIPDCPPSPLVLPNHTGNPICPPFDCKKLGSLPFPFNNESYPECGLMTVSGCTTDDPWIQVETLGISFRVKNISGGDSIVVQSWWASHPSRYKRLKCEFIQNVSSFSLTLAPSLPVLTLFKCYRSLNASLNTDYTYNDCEDDFIIHYNGPNNSAPVPPLPPKCSIIQYPVDMSSDMSNLAAVLQLDVTLQLHITTDFRKCYYGRYPCQNDGKAKIQCPYVTVAAVKAAHIEETDKPPHRKSKKLALGIGNILVLRICSDTA